MDFTFGKLGVPRLWLYAQARSVICSHISERKYIWTPSTRLLETSPQTKNVLIKLACLVSLGSFLGRDKFLRTLVEKYVNLWGHCGKVVGVWGWARI